MDPYKCHLNSLPTKLHLFKCQPSVCPHVDSHSEAAVRLKPIYLVPVINR